MTRIITIKGNAIIDIYESFEGNYWFITKKCHKQNSVLRGKVYKNDQILFGYVRLFACPEFGQFVYTSKAKLERIGAWKILRTNWEFCPEVELVDVPDYFAVGEEIAASQPISLCSNNCKEVME